MIDEIILKSIDKEIRNSIKDLNQTPFIQTSYSCSGHPKTHPPQDTPYVDIHYTSPEKGLEFHKRIMAGVPSISFRVLPINIRSKSMENILRNPNHRIHYTYNNHNKQRVNSFWDAWRNIISEYL
ncbi:MAG: hypothetical protein ACTSXK_17290 [Promethearchaeota archaeon]